MFTIGGTSYFIFQFIALSFFLFLLTKKEFILKNYFIFWLLFLIIPLYLELIVYIEAVRDNNYIRLLPLGICHLSIYLATFIMFKYNRKIHIILITLSSGAVLSLLIPAPLEGESLRVLHSYHFYLVHMYVVTIAILLAYKHNFTMNRNDYLYGISYAMIISTVIILISTITKNDELFFFSGPEGVATEEIQFGLVRAVSAYLVYFSLFSIPYVAYCTYTKLVYKKKVNLNSNQI